MRLCISPHTQYIPGSAMPGPMTLPPPRVHGVEAALPGSFPRTIGGVLYSTHGHSTVLYNAPCTPYSVLYSRLYSDLSCTLYTVEDSSALVRVTGQGAGERPGCPVAPSPGPAGGGVRPVCPPRPEATSDTPTTTTPNPPAPQNPLEVQKPPALKPSATPQVSSWLLS